jgi:CHAT domain-containing protein
VLVNAAAAQRRRGARDLMIAFYKTWLNQVRSDPAKALRDTQPSYLKHDKLARSTRVGGIDPHRVKKLHAEGVLQALHSCRQPCLRQVLNAVFTRNSV